MKKNGLFLLLVSVCLIIALAGLNACTTSSPTAKPAPSAAAPAAPATTTAPAAPKTTAAPVATVAPPPLASTTTPAAPAKVETIKLKLSHSCQPVTLHHEFSLKLKELLEKYSNGRVEVTVYPNGQLVPETENLAALKMQTIHFSLVFVGTPSAIEPRWEIWNMPLAFDASPTDMSHINRFVESAKGAGMTTKWMADKGFKVVQMVPTDVGMTPSNNVRAMRTIEDCKGIKIRMPSGGYQGKAAQLLGMSPTTIASTEVQSALTQGVIDGVYSTPIFMYDNHYSPTKYLLGTMMTTCTCPFLMSMDFFKSLPADIQKVIDEKVAPDIKAYCERRVMEEADKKIKMMQKDMGTEVTYLTADEMARWRKLFKPLYDDYAALPGGQGVLDEVQALRKK